MRAVVLSVAAIGACGRIGFDVLAGGGGGDGGGSGDAGALTYAEVVLADHPAAYWRLDDTAATVAADASGNHLDATYKQPGIGFVTVGVAGALSPAANGDVVDHAANFENLAAIDAGSNFAFGGSAPYAIEAWMSVTRNGTYRALGGVLNRNGSGTPTEGYAIEVQPIGDPGVFFFRQHAGSSASAAGAWPATTWVHVVAVYDGTSQLLYTNAALVSSVPGVAIAGGSDDFWLGADAGEAYSALDGTLDEVAVYTYALPAARVLAHYQAGTR